MTTCFCIATDFSNRKVIMTNYILKAYNSLVFSCERFMKILYLVLEGWIFTKETSAMSISKDDLHTALIQLRIFTSSSTPTHQSPFFHDNSRIRITKFLTDENLDPLLSCRTQAICWHLYHQVRINAGVWDYNSRQKVQYTFGNLLEDLVRTIKGLRLESNVVQVEELVEDVFADWITVVGFTRGRRRDDGKKTER